jgi:hypothetical protein
MLHRLTWSAPAACGVGWSTLDGSSLKSQCGQCRDADKGRQVFDSAAPRPVGVDWFLWVDWLPAGSGVLE